MLDWLAMWLMDLAEWWDWRRGYWSKSYWSGTLCTMYGTQGPMEIVVTRQVSSTTLEYRPYDGWRPGRYV